MLGRHSVYDILKDFQPALAATIALAAAALAYFAAMKKTWHEQRIAEREFAHRRLGVFMRTRAEVELISLLAKALEGQALHNFLLKGETEHGDSTTFEGGLRAFRVTPSMDEAWQYLYLFPMPVARRVNRLRQRLLQLVFITENYPKLKDKSPEKLTKNLTQLKSAADAILADLDPLIAKIDTELA